MATPPRLERPARAEAERDGGARGVGADRGIGGVAGCFSPAREVGVNLAAARGQDKLDRAGSSRSPLLGAAFLFSCGPVGPACHEQDWGPHARVHVH